MSPLKSCALLTLAALFLTATAVQAGDVYLGITMSPITSSMARALQLDEDEGVLIDEVVADSPAEAAGLQPGDVIVAIEGRAITGSKSLSKAIHRFDPGDEVTITVVRSGDRRDLNATLGEKKSKKYTVWSSDEGGSKVFAWVPDGDEDLDVVHEDNVIRIERGDGEDEIIVRTFGDSDRGFLGIVPGPAADRDGVLVADLVDDGPAEGAGIHEGDLIVALDGEPIANGKELHKFLVDTEAGQTLEVRVVRDGDEHAYDVELADRPSQLKLSDVYMPGRESQSWISLKTGPHADIEKLEQEREDFEEMRAELEDLKAELQALREELQKKK